MPISHISLELADGYRLTLDAEYARALTLALLRAHAAADTRQRRIFGYDGRSSGIIALGQSLDKSGNVDTHGTCCYATRILAVQAARCFELRLLFVVAVAHLLEVGGTEFRVLFAYCDARYFVLGFFRKNV